MVLRVGIVGYGNIGKYLCLKINQDDNFEIAFVWNRTVENIENIEKSLILPNLAAFATRTPDIIVEVAHPDVVLEYGEAFVQIADFIVGSPVALANQEFECKITKASKLSGHAVYVPSGALWGGADIRKMAELGTLQAVEITMRKHPSCLKVLSPLKELNCQVEGLTPKTLYRGPVRQLCPLAPNNVNTMAAASIAANNLGFDKVIGHLVADPTLTDWHIVEVKVTGSNGFEVETIRRNPANIGAVSGQATLAAFYSSLKVCVTYILSVSEMQPRSRMCGQSYLVLKKARRISHYNGIVICQCTAESVMYEYEVYVDGCIESRKCMMCHPPGNKRQLPQHQHEQWRIAGLQTINEDTQARYSYPEQTSDGDLLASSQ